MNLRHVVRLAGLACVAAIGVAGVGVDVRASAPPTTEPVPTDPVPADLATPDSVPEAAPGAPRILLTNDDGWSGGGLLPLYEALAEAGFDVVVFAPMADVSGGGSSMTFDQPLQLSRVFGNVFAVSGSPADAVEAGMSLAFGGTAPDLVISGPNPGFTVGDTVINSGTLGAVATAINDGVPAIAVSAGPNPQTNQPDFTTANTLIIDLVNALVENAGDDALLLPAGLGLNVNVPFTAPDAPPTGVAITSTGIGHTDFEYAPLALPGNGETILVEPEVVENPTADPAFDSTAVAAGLVAVTFVEGNYDAADPDDRASAIAALTPVLTGVFGSDG